LYPRKNFSGDELFWTNKIIFEKKSIKRLKDENNENVCVIIPARNEKFTIVETLNSVLNQGLKKLFILIVDDNSNDGTSKLAKKTLIEAKFNKFKIIKGKKLKKGWSGKVWALKQAIDYLKQKKEITHYLFIDSDIVLEKNIINDTLKFLKNKKLIMVSLMAKLNCQSFWEKLLIPSFIYFFQKLYPFSSVNNLKSSVAAAAGGYIICTSRPFLKKNLYNYIKDKVIDDCNIARLLKKEGKIWLGLTNRIKSNRNYEKFGDLRKMIARTAFEQLKYSITLVILSTFGMLLIYVYPYFALVTNFNNLDTFRLTINLVTIVLMTISLIPTVNFYKLNYIYYFSLPISATFYIFMTIDSTLNHFLKKGNVWKGRKY
tara:strand:+ start:162 stop:1280 length:1119 start_codon:yes stop_codon:yes gene_type:complete